jgi:hypothetical protein
MLKLMYFELINKPEMAFILYRELRVLTPGADSKC